MKGDIVRSNADFISNLPYNIIEHILGCLPLRDVVRTSILSREWRYRWLSCPVIIFDFWFDHMFLGGRNLAPVIYQILERHQGLLSKFVLQVPHIITSPDINRWVHLLPNQTLQEFNIYVSRGEPHRLTSHILTFRNLRTLKIYNCFFEPPHGFEGFNKLVDLELHNSKLKLSTFGEFLASCASVEKLRLIHCTKFDCLEITGPKLKSFDFHGVFRTVVFKNCPVLTNVKFYFASVEFKSDGLFSFALVKSLSCLPALNELQLQAFTLEDLVGYGAPNKLPIELKTLKGLHLSDMYFEKTEETSCAICFIRSCPNLQRLKIREFTFDAVGSVAEFLRSQKRSASFFTHLRTVNMQLFTGMESEMEFAKYLLASASVLEELMITPHEATITDGGESVLNELRRYPRASPNVAIVTSERKKLI